MSGAVELVCHCRCHDPPTEHLSLLGKFQNRAHGLFALTWRQHEERSRESATSATNYGLAQAQVPMASGEDVVIWPTDLFAK